MYNFVEGLKKLKNLAIYTSENNFCNFVILLTIKIIT